MDTGPVVGLTRGRRKTVTDDEDFRGGNCEYFKTFIGRSRKKTLGHCIKSSNRGIRR